MNAKTILNKIRIALSMDVKLDMMNLADGTQIEAESFAPDMEVFIVSGENRVALPIGEYVLENGQILVVATEGIIAEIKDPVQEEAPTEETPAAVEAPEMEAEQTPKKIVESISKEMFFEEMQKFAAVFNEKLEALKPIVIEEKTTEKITHSPEVELPKNGLELKVVKNSSREKIFKKLNS